MSGNFAIKGGGGGRPPNGKCHLKFPFWFSAYLPYTFCKRAVAYTHPLDSYDYKNTCGANNVIPNP